MLSRRQRLVLAALCALCSCTSLRLPPPRAVAGPSANTYPDAAAVVLQDEATLSFRTVAGAHSARRWVAVLDHHRVVKILRPEGLGQARVALPVDGLRQIKRVVARAVSPAGKVRDADVNNVRLLPRTHPRQQAKDVRCLVLQVPGAEVGGAVEYRYEQVFDDPYDVPPWLFGGTLPVVHARFGIVSPDALQVDLLHGRGDAGFDRVALRRDRYGNGQRLLFAEDNLPAFYPEPAGVHPAHRVPWLAVALRRSRAGGPVPTMDSWDDVAARVLDRMEDVVAEPGKGSTARRLVAVRQALNPLQLLGLGLRRPQAAEDLAAGEPACTRDATGFALGRVGGLGKDVRVVLATGPLAPPFASTFPARYPFSRAALALRMDDDWQHQLSCEGAAWRRDYLCTAAPGEFVFFAPDCTSCAVGIVPPELAGSRALAVDGNGRARWVTLDVGEPQRHARNMEARLTMDVAGTLTGTVDVEVTGMAAARWRAALEAAVDGEVSLLPEASAADDSVGHTVRRTGGEPANEAATGGSGQSGAPGTAEAVAYRQIYGDGRAPRADGLVVRGAQDLDRGLFAHAQVTSQARRTTTDTYLLRPDDLAGESIPANWHDVRQESALLGGPAWQDTLVLVTLPLGVEAELAPPVKWVHPAAEYAAGFVQHGRTLKFQRRFVRKTAGLDASDWPDFAEFFGRIRAYEKAAVRLRPPR